MKRAADMMAAAVLLVALGIPMVCVALAILLTDGGPVLFRQQRMGRAGVPFSILKFRTMRPPRPGDEAVTTGPADSRITPLGGRLRRHRIDEWPQLWNVWRGEMSLVGPRPEVPRYVDLDDPQWQMALSVRPGITGSDALHFKDEGDMLAQAQDPDACYRNEILPKKLALQAAYAQHRSLRGDLVILFRTLGALRG